MPDDANWLQPKRTSLPRERFSKLEAADRCADQWLLMLRITFFTKTH
jgi:hypothetical protein